MSNAEQTRLLQICNRTLGGGGEDLATRQIARILSQTCGFAETVFESADWTGPGAPPPWQQAMFTFYNPRAIGRIRDAHRRLGAHAWILHNYVPVVSAGVFSEARRQHVPIVQYIHNFRPFSVSSYLWSGRPLDPAAWPATFLEETRQGAWQNSRLKTAFLATVFASLHLTGQFRAVKAWIAVSDFMRDKFILAGVPPESIFRLYNPWVPQSESPGFAESDFYLFLGRLIEEKGVRVIVEAWHRLLAAHPKSAPRLVIAGDGPLSGWVREASARNPAIEFRGPVTGQDKERLLQTCRALIAPSIWWDPAPYVVYEAYNAAKPVLASASGGLRELVRHGVTGFHHEAGNAEQLVRDVLEMDATGELRRRMGANGRQWLMANTNDTVWKKGFFNIIDYAVHSAMETEDRGPAPEFTPS